MIRRVRWWWDLAAAALLPIREDLAACCGCGRVRRTWDAVDMYAATYVEHARKAGAR